MKVSARMWLLAALLLLATPAIAVQSIADKKKALSQGLGELESDISAAVREINDELLQKRQQLSLLHQQAQQLIDSGADVLAYKTLGREISAIREDIRQVEEQWQAQGTREREEEYALWYQPETTLGQLIVDYGDRNFIYLIPPEIGSVKISVSSSLPIPVESWGDMLELLLVSKGVGTRQLNPYLKELYVLNDDISGVERITDQRDELDLLAETTRVAFVLQPPAKDVSSTFHMLKRFVNERNTAIYIANRQLYIVGYPKTVKELLKLYDFVGSGTKGSDFRLVPVAKMSAEEMASILQTVFSGVSPESFQVDLQDPNYASSAGNAGGLVIMPLATLPHSLFIMGSQRDIEQAVEIVNELESQVGDIKEKTMYWYRVKHSEPSELAEVLERVYQMMSGEGLHEDGEEPTTIEVDVAPPLPVQGEYLRGVEPNLRVRPTRVDPGAPIFEGAAKELQNFIVDEKSGAIIMVVEHVYLARMKSLLRRLDVPKQMVQIEVLLVEHRANLKQDCGLNLLRLGDCATNTRSGCMRWNDTESSSANKGILEFLFSREKTPDFPAFDLGMKFLLSQENVVINSAPSVTTVNQTAATIHIVEEISLSTGIVELDTTRDTTVKDAFTRAQYGITIEVTPTIHLVSDDLEDEEGFDYITMETYINFDENSSTAASDRPNILRREVRNTVRVADGESLIIGGLRNKKSSDTRDTVPYLCEIPGLGKLFGTNSLVDQSTEMFVFITPRIVGPCDPEASELRRTVMCERPGEGPSFFRLVSEAKEQGRQRQREEGVRRLLGQSDDSFTKEAQAYDGR